jgi:hypothetical protein
MFNLLFRLPCQEKVPFYLLERCLELNQLLLSLFQQLRQLLVFLCESCLICIEGFDVCTNSFVCFLNVLRSKLGCFHFLL